MANKILNSLQGRGYGWPISIITDVEDIKKHVTAALREGPYGKCVYESDNHVMSHQVSVPVCMSELQK